MYNLFAFAIGVRLLAFIVFVLRLWRKSSICQTGTMTNQVLEEDYLCDSLFAFSPPCNLCRLVCILLWIKCLDALLMLGHFCLVAKDSKFMTRKFHPIYQDEVVFAFF
ncbi:Uncharacterised protein [Streptococcus pneumoniae]|nr:Uncharacterised protein [Streptococcus pneumoniae]CIT16561.1 Uncharacterised protein [Streptococcus pneumoniae]CIV38995.1 Uncharacterised protein [Streptococcus pneumoniae]CJM25112.1 Uncharacterised protein [Streptococcus pneumoniae]COA03712.1 Uncharacterised protein [Streptococcus pneumoniae]